MRPPTEDYDSDYEIWASQFYHTSILQIFWLLQEGPFKKKQVNGCPQIDKFSTYNIHAVHRNEVSPRIGILGASTYPSEGEIGEKAQYVSG